MMSIHNLQKGNGKPVFGKIIVVTAMLTNDCTPKSTPNPKQNSLPCSVGALEPVIKHSTTMANNNNITAAAPTNPNSSPTIAKIKSVCDSGRKLPSFTERTFPLSLKPLPVKPP